MLHGVNLIPCKNEVRHRMMSKSDFPFQQSTIRATGGIGKSAQAVDDSERGPQTILGGVQVKYPRTFEIELKFSSRSHRDGQENAVVPGHLARLDRFSSQVNGGWQAENFNSISKVLGYFT